MNIKKIIAGAISLVIMCGAVPGQNEAFSDFTMKASAVEETFGDFTYESAGDCIYITAYNGTASSVTIPARINGLPVTDIDDGAFENNDTLVSVVIPDTVTRIWYYAFAYCDNLTNITFSKNLDSLLSYAFQQCPKLKTISLPDSVTFLGEAVFRECTGLTSVTLPKNLSDINLYTFDECTSLTAINVHPDCERFASKDGILFSKDMTTLFSYPLAKAGTSYTVPDGVKIIEEGAFKYNKTLTEISLPDSLIDIRKAAFSSTAIISNQTTDIKYVDDWAISTSSDSSITSFTVREGTRGIAAEAFYGVNGRACTSVTLPNSITSICERAFYNCRSLTSLNFPSNVQFVGESAFGLTPLITNQSGAQYMGKWVVDCSADAVNVVIKDGTVGIAEGAFKNAENLESVVLPEGITAIPRYAFRGLRKLSSVNIPDSVTSIGDFAFSVCQSLESIVIPKNVKSIGLEAFSSCSSLKEIAVMGSKCQIYDTEYTFHSRSFKGVDYYDFDLFGYKNSTTAAHAEKYGLSFYTFSKTGDANNDGNIDPADASAILSEFSSTSMGGEGKMKLNNKIASDIDNDGVIGPVDATNILRYYSYVSMGGKLPIEFYLATNS